MMLEKLFYGDKPWLLFFFSLALFLLVLKVGNRFGKRDKDNVDELTKSWLVTIDGVILGMLGLLLAFSFGMAQQRFDTRKRLVIDEANAIGTTYLRSQWLPEPRRTEISKLLRQYVDLRLSADLLTGIDENMFQQRVAQSDRLQDQLWSHAIDIAKADSASPIAALFIVTLNETIDLQSKRLAAFRNHIPPIILLLLYLFAGFSILLSGYVSGFRDRRSLFAMFTMVGLLTFFLFVIVDLDSPQQGLITVNPESLIKLQKQLHADATPSATTKGQ
jgi:hypothetical protein